MLRFIMTWVVVCVLSSSQFLSSEGMALASDQPIASSVQSSSATSQQADQELAKLRENPEEFRTLVTGIQIFLGRFGYGVGPYTGQLDQATKDALRAYQKKTGLTETGDINFHTLRSLTEDDSVLSRVVPFLPAQSAQVEKWDEWVEVQGTWMLKEGNTDDVLRTTRITCMREFQRCIDSTASLVNSSTPQLKVHTHVYDIKEWDDDKIVSLPYDGEACALSILRISKKPMIITRFVTLQGKPGMCAKVKADDQQYLLKDGQEIYQSLKMQKAKAIQQILQVAQYSSAK